MSGAPLMPRMAPGGNVVSMDIAGSPTRSASQGAVLMSIAHGMTHAELFGMAPIPADPVMPVWKYSSNDASGTRRTHAHWSLDGSHAAPLQPTVSCQWNVRRRGRSCRRRDYRLRLRERDASERDGIQSRTTEAGKSVAVDRPHNRCRHRDAATGCHGTRVRIHPGKAHH